MNLCFSVLLLPCILQLAYGAISVQVFPIEHNKPEVCVYNNGETLAAGESLRDIVNCIEYTCYKEEIVNKLLLTTTTCGLLSMRVDPPCYVGSPPPYTPYPQCCQPKIICPKDRN